MIARAADLAVAARSEAARPGPSHAVFDVVHVGDFRAGGDTPWRVANMAAIENDEGYATALLHVPWDSRRRADAVHPLVDRVVERREAWPVDPSLAIVQARLILVHGPLDLLSGILRGGDLRLPRIVAPHVVAIADAAPDGELTKADALLRSMFGAGLVWAAVDPDVQRALAALGGVSVADEVWGPSIPISASLRPIPRRPSPVIGVILSPLTDLAESAGLQSWLADVDGDVTIRLMGGAPDGAHPPPVQHLGEGEMSPRRFVAGLDFLAAPPGTVPPAEAIAWAMAHGVPVILPRSLASRFGHGPVYAAAGDMIRLARDIYADAARLHSLRHETADQARMSYSASTHAARLRHLVGRPSEPPRRADAGASGRRKRVLLVSSNGFGLGHLTRLLAIARRLPGEIEPVFATMSQAMPIVRQAGYPVEYLPANVFGNVEPGDWNGWLSAQFAQIIDFHRPAAIVFDGGLPYAGILDAVATRDDVRLVWVRRGMWRDFQSNAELIARQRFFDLVIEPGDIAAESDRGATVGWRSHALQVPPVGLLEESELFDRTEAAARLGLDAARPAVLVQLGSGANRDVVGMVGEVLKALADRPGLQPVLLQWLIAPAELDLWPGIRRLRGFPVAKYYRAFDFTISAAGYNSFNDIVAFGLPAIFVSNEHPMLDDQGGRAAFAEANGAAFSVAEEQLHSLGALVDAILDERVQWLMKANCHRLAQPNGAAAAAAAIAGLIGLEAQA